MQENECKMCMMVKLGEIFQSSDWKKEKHVPVIECSDSVKSGDKLAITVSEGKEITELL